MRASAVSTACLLGFCPVVWGVEAAASAPPSHRVLVAPYEPLGEQGAGLAGAKFGESLQANLGGRPGRLALLKEAKAPAGDLGGPFGGGSVGALNLRDARGHKKVGEGLLETGEAERAMGELAQSIKLFESNLAFVKDEAELIEVHLLHAASAFQAGYEDDGEQALRRVLVMRPDLDVKERGFPPLFKSLVEKYVRRMKKDKRSTLAVASDPSPATVFVDGVDVGETGDKPLVLDDMVPGHHYVRIVRPMMGVWAHKIEAPPAGERAELTVTLPTIGGEAMATDDRSAADAAAARSVQDLSAALATGVVDRDAKDRAYELALRVGATHVAFGVVAPVAGAFALKTYLLRTEPKAVVDLGTVQIDAELLELGVLVHEVAERIVAALDAFPEVGLVPDEAQGPALLMFAPVAAAPPPPPPLAPAPPIAAVSPLEAAPAPVEPPQPFVSAPPSPVAPAVAAYDVVPAAQTPIEPFLPGPMGPLAVPPPPPEPVATRYAEPIGGPGPVPAYAPPRAEGRPDGARWVLPALGVVAIAGGTAAALLLLDKGDAEPRSFRTEVAW